MRAANSIPPRRRTASSSISTRPNATHRGLVEYEADFFILRPADPRRGSGVLVYDVTNRGRKVILGRLDEAPGDADTNNPRTVRDAGLAFTLGRGYSLVWSGWDSGAPRANNGMTARLPAALENGKPMVRRIRDEFHIGTRAPGKGDVVRLQLSGRLGRPAPSSADCSRPRKRRAHRDPGRGLGVCRRADDPAVAGRHAVRSVQNLRDLVRGDGIACHAASALPRPATWSRSCATNKPTATGGEAR